MNIEEVKKFYDVNNRFCGYGSLESIHTRYKVIYNLYKDKIDEFLEIKILDVGCGKGLFLDWLEDHLLATHIDYTGIDIYDPYIEIAQSKLDNKFKGMKAKFLKQEFLDPNFDPVNKYDVVIMNGVLNYQGTGVSTFDTYNTAFNFINKMYKATTNVVIFTMTSTYEQQFSPETVHDETCYFDPAEIFRFAMNTCGNVSLDHSYLLHDFAIRMIKK
jgi:2-polyprenyl-3-methyl-5-hydroxy-6-metoxy-1,4-benzoquinol methylase